MARETKVEKMARLNREVIDREIAERDSYPTRLMGMLERACQQGSTLEVTNGVFVLTHHENWTNYKSAIHISPNYTAHDSNELYQLDRKLQWAERERAEAYRLNKVRADALTRVKELLNAEEQQLLGLN